MRVRIAVLIFGVLLASVGFAMSPAPWLAPLALGVLLVVGALLVDDEVAP